MTRDQFVGRYYDHYDPIPTAGFMGVYLNDTALVGTFSNFAVYPVRPPSSFEYV